MSKRQLTDDEHQGESATLVSGGGSSAPTPGSTVPVQETNILQILEQHLPKEHKAVVVRIRELEEQLMAATKYREQLERIAHDAAVTLSPIG